MVVAHGQIVHGAHHDLAVFYDGTVFGGVHAQNGRLRWVDDGGGHHGAKHATVRDGEGAARHVFQAQFAVFGFLAELSNFLFDFGKAHLIGITNDGHH